MAVLVCLAEIVQQPGGKEIGIAAAGALETVMDAQQVSLIERRQRSERPRLFGSEDGVENRVAVRGNAAWEQDPHALSEPMPDAARKAGHRGPKQVGQSSS